MKFFVYLTHNISGIVTVEATANLVSHVQSVIRKGRYKEGVRIQNLEYYIHATLSCS